MTLPGPSDDARVTEPGSLRAGRERYQAARRVVRVRQAVERVKAFQRWKAHGFAAEHAPAVLPSDTDFKLARERAGRQERRQAGT